MLETAECTSLIKCRTCQLRKVNEQAYTPTFIYIGPFHQLNKDFQTLENYKVKYLKSFIARANVKLENLACIIRDNEETIRSFYAETMLGRLHNNDFEKMILMDSIFILELFLRNYYRLWESDDPKVADQWMTPLLMLDLLLVENQLPFFVLEILFTLAFPSPSKKFPSLIQLTFLYFDCFNVQNITPIDVKIEHFTDLVRTFQLPPIPSLTGR